MMHCFGVQPVAPKRMALAGLGPEWARGDERGGVWEGAMVGKPVEWEGREGGIGLACWEERTRRQW
jgi:hypothetical protein